MNTRTLLLPILFICSMAFAQVGINTNQPEATLDIKAINHLGSVTAKDGLLIPRVNSLTANGSINGQLVYLIEDITGFSKGFYYWNNSNWQTMGGFNNIVDTTNDAWLNKPANAKIHLNALSNSTTTPRPAGTEFSIADNGMVGIGTEIPRAALDLSSTTAGFVPPKLSTLERDALLAANKPAATLIYNTTINKVQINVGTGILPNWMSFGGDVASMNTVAVWKKTSSQLVGTVTTPLSFDSGSVYDGMPAGYVVQTDATTWNLAKGKVYEIMYDQGYIVGNTANTSNCAITLDGVLVDSSRSRAIAGNGANTNYATGSASGFAIVQATETAVITLTCFSGAGSKSYASSAISFPRIQFKILN